MPIMDGFEAASSIRQMESPNQEVPIIALTANVVSGIKAECQEAGMNDILNKPVQLNVMKDMLDKWLMSAP